MNNKPLQEYHPEDEGATGDSSRQRPNQLSRWIEALARLGLGEASVRIGTHVLALILVVGVVWLMQTLYRQANLGWTPRGVAAAAESTPTPALTIDQLPAEVAPATDGIARSTNLHTTIPSRPRMDVEKYTVQQGDSLFGIADKFGLKPTTILFGNYDVLKDRTDTLSVGQVLNILPVDGVYYLWNGTDSLNGWGRSFNVDPEVIVNFPGNHLDPDTIGDLDHPNIAAGTWLVVPGGQRQFTSWSAPAQLVQADPSSGVWGPGVCTGIHYIQVGYGNFIYPTVEHWLSGTPYRPDVGHYAVDFAGSLGNAIYASDAGTVVYAGWNDWGYGNLVVLDHGNGWETRYAHLSQINVSCGQNVGQGDIIALMGSTGNSTGPHLHFEMVSSTYGRVDPLLFLP
jgi:hypothetical protein